MLRHCHWRRIGPFLPQRSIPRCHPCADLTLTHAPLEGARIDGALTVRAIDELPLVATIASQAQGTTTIRDAAELRVKESDRIETTVKELGRLGAKIEGREDGMVIQGAGHFFVNELDEVRCFTRDAVLSHLA